MPGRDQHVRCGGEVDGSAGVWLGVAQSARDEGAGGANGLIFYAYQHLSEPHEDPEDAFEPAWARTKAMAGEFKKYMDVFLSIDSAPTVGCSNGAVAVRTWRRDGDTYLLAVNCTTNAQTATLTLSEPVGKVAAADFGPMPKVSGDKVEVSLGAIDYVMLRLTP